MRAKLVKAIRRLGRQNGLNKYDLRRTKKRVNSLNVSEKTDFISYLKQNKAYD